MEVNERHVRFFYRLLNHRFNSELRFLKRGLFPSFRIVENEEEFLSACQTWNGKRNIYTVIRDRAPGLKGCATFKDIVGLQTMVLDIDPIREAETPSSEGELKNAISVADLIARWFEQNGFQRPYRAVTGNGTCLYFSLPFLEIKEKDREEVSRRLQIFEERMRRIFRKELKSYNCRIDNMYDLPRIAKVIGTWNIKGEESEGRPWRLSYWIEEPVERRVDENLLKFLLNQNEEEKIPVFLGSVSVSGKIKEENKKEECASLGVSPEAPAQFGPVWLMQPIPYFGEKLKGDWICEPKIDGWRMQIIKGKEQVEFWGRRLERKPNWTERLKSVPQSALNFLPSGTILDCELYCDQGRRFIPSLFTLQPKGKPIIYVFDLIFYRWKFLGGLPLSKRKEILSQIPFKEPCLLVLGEKLDNLEVRLREAVLSGHEGIVIKELNSPYLLGKDAPMATANWRKIKPR